MSGALDRELRRALGKAVAEARRIAEEGARGALGSLAVEQAEPDASMSAEAKELRRRLRAHARALGDRRLGGGKHEITRLAHEVAYEHWHRMLFARFLAENGLLIHPEYEVEMSLDDCRDLALEEGKDPWELASRWAERMLPQVFRPDDPSLAVTLFPETRQRLEKLLAGLPRAVFLADDSIGWAYQFWQSERKDQVNRSGVKIGADELPVVTQLFTERYMVRFLFHNTVGAWRAGKILAERSELATCGKDEDELRRTVALCGTKGSPRTSDGYEFEYLRFVREGSEEADDRSSPEGEGSNAGSRADHDGEAANAGSGSADGGKASNEASSGPWRPAAGAYSKWPRAAKDLKFLDPCCGSGHFLVEGFQLFVRLRMEEEGLALDDAIQAVLRDNLHGLELDRRCVQLAAFSVALAAWKLAGDVIELPPLNIACSGLAPHASEAEWKALGDHAAAAAGAPLASAARQLSRRGPRPARQATLPSVESATLENPHRENWGAPYRRPVPAGAANSPAARGHDASDAGWTADTLKELRTTLDGLYALFGEAPTLGSLLNARRASTDLGTLPFAWIEPILKRVLEQTEPEPELREHAVAAAGMAEAAEMLAGRYSLVITTPPYLARGKQKESLRKFAVEQHREAKGELATMFVQRALAWQGESGVQSFVLPQNWLFLKTYRKLREELLHFRHWRFLARLGEHAFEDTSAAGAFAALTILSAEKPTPATHFAGLDASAPRGQTPIPAPEKARLLRESKPRVLSQRNQIYNPEARVTLLNLRGTLLLSGLADGHQGIATSDYSAFGRKFWELPATVVPWTTQQSTVTETADFGGREHVVFWGKEGEVYEAHRSQVRIQGGGSLES